MYDHKLKFKTKLETYIDAKAFTELEYFKVKAKEEIIG